ncbi:MAG: ABC transporter permease [Rickettsiales bacterium]|nr:ABC transporter permease [Rickettsiales bacterium]
MAENDNLNIMMDETFNDREREKLFKVISDGKIKRVNIKVNGDNLVVLAKTFRIVELIKAKNIDVDIDGLSESAKQLIKIALSSRKEAKSIKTKEQSFFKKIGEKAVDCFDSFMNGINFLLLVLQSLKNLLLLKAQYRKVDLYSSLENATFKALPIVSLINFMIGVILALVGALELKIFGAEIYIASLVSISMVRIVGAIMTGIVMSGRIGASYAATIGTMKVNEEIDALKTMGVSTVDFLLLPRIIALIIATPMLTMFTEIIGIFGGAFVGIFILNLPPVEYFRMSVTILSLNHFLVGLLHSFVFGVIISLCGCYYGLNCSKNADGVGKATTMAVVSSTVWIIIATGAITGICEVFGI